MRQSRKLDHLQYSIALSDGPGRSGFADFHLVHNCLPGLAMAEIDLTTKVAGIPLVHPIIINAITGGAADVTGINAALAELAKRTGAAMAVGSQYSGLEKSNVRESYTIVRDVNPEGIIFANLGAYASPDEAGNAVEMIRADAIQIHLNVAQELVMSEGDRDFRNSESNIRAIVASSKVPVIAKEVGCGIAREQAVALMACGVNVIDVGGVGGTNFIAIEAARSKVILSREMLHWGIPTAVSAVEVASVLKPEVDLIVSGGIRSADEVIKSLTLGSRAVGIAAPLVRLLQEKGLEAAEEWMNELLENMRRLMLLAGVRRIEEFRHVPLVITGKSRDWLTARGVNIKCYGNR